MKKFLVVSLSLIILMGALCACGSSSDFTASPEEIDPLANVNTPAAIYLKNSSVWEVQSEDTPYGYMFIDLDFDGTLELIQSKREAGSDKTTNKFFGLDMEKKTVYEIPCSDEDAKNLWNFEGGDYPQLYKNTATNTLVYQVYDNTRESEIAGGTRIGEFTYSAKEGIKTHTRWGFSYKSEDGSYNGKFTFVYTSYDENGNKKEISQDEYNKVLDDYLKSHINLNLKFTYIYQTSSQYTYSQLSTQEKLDLLTDAYNSFSYSK